MALAGGSVGWWVGGEHAQTAVNDGSELLICAALRAAHSRNIGTLSYR